MEKYLILVDNDREELNKLMDLISHSASANKINVIDIFVEKYDENSLQHTIIKKVKDLIKTTSNGYFHIIIDACLTEEEHEISGLCSRDYLSGLECASSIVPILENCDNSFIISIMSRFFVTQLDSYNAFINFSKNKNNNFYAVIRKPILDTGDVDTGLSPIPQYTDKLPEKYLSRKYSTAFKNIVLYSLLEDKTDEI